MTDILKEHRWLPIADLSIDNEDVKAFLNNDNFSKLYDTEKNDDKLEVAEPIKDHGKKVQKSKPGKKIKADKYETGKDTGEPSQEQDLDPKLVEKPSQNYDEELDDTDTDPDNIDESVVYGFLPKKTLGVAIREIHENLKQIERTVDKQIKLKTESGLQSSHYWKRTHKSLTNIEERMIRISNKLKRIKG